jgi:DNA/RNA-binding domain of Phe-tRNA-synthetase-like protein
MHLVIEKAVREKFEISIGIAEIRDVRQKEKESSEISNEIAEVAEEIKSNYRIEEVKEIRTIRLQRDFFWRMGIDPTKIRPASEALLRRILLNKGLPRVSPMVDAYNLASVRTLLTFSAFDLERIEPPLSVRFSRAREEVTLIGDRRKELTGKEIVLTDSAKILCVYVHGDVEETKVTDSTKDALLVAYGIPGMSKEELKEGVITASNYIKRFAGGEVVIGDVYM